MRAGRSAGMAERTIRRFLVSSFWFLWAPGEKLVRAANVVGVERFGRNNLAQLNFFPAKAGDGVAARTWNFFHAQASRTGENDNRLIGGDDRLIAGGGQEFLLSEQSFFAVTHTDVDFFPAGVHGGQGGLLRRRGNGFEQ